MTGQVIYQVTQRLFKHTNLIQKECTRCNSGTFFFIRFNFCCLRAKINWFTKNIGEQLNGNKKTF